MDHRSVHISKCDGTTSVNDLEKLLKENPSTVEGRKASDIIARHSQGSENNSCPVCNKQFPKDASENDRLSHTNKCLDESIREIPEQERTDEMLARSLQEQLWPDQQQSTVEECHMCFKDISKLSIQQRLVHVNNCMDKMESIEGKYRRTLPQRRAKGTRKTKAATKSAPTTNKKSPGKARRTRNAPKKPCPICGSDVLETVE